MRKAFPLILFVLGAALGYVAQPSPPAPTAAPAISPNREECTALEGRIAALEEELRVAQASSAASPIPSSTPQVSAEPLVEPASPAEPAAETPPTDLVSMRVAAVERFVKLSPAQRDELREKFRAEGEGEDAPSLEQILGPADASVYRQQVKDAFRRAESASLDKETYYLGRRLNLDPSQEVQVRALLEQIESDMKHRPPSRAKSMRERLAAYMDSQNERADRLRQGLSQFLTAEQQRQYLQLEAESPERDLPLFHGEEGE